uniref:CCR4-NOT transcription complex subunit 1-like n=1 Tax=Erigeron canadensis TaxID=72917 RepID=UPI001CB978C9|nr:CCR4-NOT transcription complex subunit 1-like [Erigeron canadensis]
MKNNGDCTVDLSTSQVVKTKDDIETEGNSYLGQYFSGKLTIDAMIQTMTGLRQSSNQRERSIFECMIANYFEEYKFFNRYPDRQLRLAALLLGSLIKNHLLTHLPLGIALRQVLDASRKPVDSKMYSFGITALEQFTERLKEWPMYCKHILKISHLRVTHSELVSFVEITLAGDTSHSLPANQHNSPVSQPNNEPETMAPPTVIPSGSF